MHTVCTPRGRLGTVRAVERYKTAVGEERYRVRFRKGQGKTARASSLTFTEQRAAERFAKELDVLGWEEAVRRQAEKHYGTGNQLLDEYARGHFDSQANITDGTRVSYHRIYSRVWSKPFGHLTLDQITRQKISAVLLEMSRDGKSDKTVANAYGILAGLMNNAVIDGIIPASPCKGVKLPKGKGHEKAEMVVLDHEAFDLLLDKIEQVSPHYVPLVMTLVGTGIRWGEAEALEVRDLVLVGNHPSLTVRRAVKWDASKATRDVGAPKTKAGRRTIELGPELVDILATITAGKGKSDRVFAGPKGGPIRHRTFWSDIWRPALFLASQCDDHFIDGCKCGTAHPKRCEIHAGELPDPCGCAGTIERPLRIHDLRHTFASWLIAAGVPMNVVQYLLGHESIKTTVDTYSHLMPEAKRAAAMAMSGLLSGSGRELVR